jgi:hypothetical protein
MSPTKLSITRRAYSNKKIKHYLPNLKYKTHRILEKKKIGFKQNVSTVHGVVSVLDYISRSTGPRLNKNRSPIMKSINQSPMHDENQHSGGHFSVVSPSLNPSPNPSLREPHEHAGVAKSPAWERLYRPKFISQ